MGLLNLPMPNAKISTFQGAGSVNQVSVFFDDIGVSIGSIPRFSTTIAFSAALNQCGFGLLRQSGFFDRFRVHFDHASGFFYIEDSQPTSTAPVPTH
jgi:hypothetical protein